MNGAAKVQTSGAPPSGERRQVAVLFADMVGFTAISERLGEEATFALASKFYNLLADAITEQGGFVKDFTGDGVMALFGAPDPLEDAPLRACRAGLLIHERMAAAAPAWQAQHGVRPEVRVGINSGVVVVAHILGDDGVTALGDTVNFASRLQKLAEPGTVYLSEATRRLVEGQAETTFLGEQAIKGKSEAQRIYRLDSIRPHATRFAASVYRGLSAHVGRDRELGVLERALAEAGGGVRIIDIVADPGMGKSRLLYEFRRRLGDDQARVIQGSCTPDGRQTPFRPFIEAMRDLFQIANGESEAEVRRRLEDGLGRLGMNGQESVALMINLIGLTPQGDALKGLDGALVGLRTRDMLQAVLESRCRRSLVALLIEDIHWIDRASADVLTQLADSKANVAFLVVHTRRPEYEPAWRTRPAVTTLRLDPLPASDIGQIVRTRLGVEALPEPLARIIADKADGNALFAEEIVTFLVERNAVRVRDGGVEFEADRTAAALPASIQLLLTARVGSLAAADREVLQIASVIGRKFEMELLATIVDPPRDVTPHLSAAEAADILRQDSVSGEFSFKHVLLRDALYDSLLSARRTNLHLRVARELERRRANQLMESAELLAHHYSFTDETGKAFEYMYLSGTKSLGVYSLEEAERHFRAALNVVDRSPGCADDKRVASAVASLLEALYLRGELLETKRVAERHIPRIEQLGASPELVFALYFHAMILSHSCEFERAEAISKRALEIARQTGDLKAAIYARQALLFCSTVLARWPLDVAEREGAELIAETERLGDNYLLNWTYWSIAWDYITRGLVCEARAWVHKLIDSGLERNDRRALGMAYWTLSWVDLYAERFDEAVNHASECVKAAVTPFDVFAGQHAKVTAELLSGQVGGALTHLEEQRDWLEKNGWLYGANGSEMSICAALALGGRLTEAVRRLESGIAASDRYGDAFAAASNRVALAEIYVAILTNAGKPSVSVLLANVGTIVVGKLFGLRRAMALLERARSNPQVHERGILSARIGMNEALLLARMQRFDEARKRLLAARAAAQAQGVGPMAARIDAALARLPAAA